jgi:predicted signal transduction protein with EAL and GGDEF domain
MPLLGEAMLAQALAALRAWDAAGLKVPSVSVNFSARELSDPELPDRLTWHLDQHGLVPARLTIEVLESVVAKDGDDIIARNIRRVADMGCGVDMDDFGTGNASITSIRRFALRRLTTAASCAHSTTTATSSNSSPRSCHLPNGLGLRRWPKGWRRKANTRCWRNSVAVTCRAISWHARCRRKQLLHGWSGNATALQRRCGSVFGRGKRGVQGNGV